MWPKLSVKIMILLPQLTDYRCEPLWLTYWIVFRTIYYIKWSILTDFELLLWIRWLIRSIGTKEIKIIWNHRNSKGSRWLLASTFSFHGEKPSREGLRLSKQPFYKDLGAQHPRAHWEPFGRASMEPPQPQMICVHIKFGKHWSRKFHITKKKMSICGQGWKNPI